MPHHNLEHPSPELIADLQLSLTNGIGPKLYTALLQRFGSAIDTLSATPEQLRSVEGVGPKLVREIVMAAEKADVKDLLNTCAANKINIVTRANGEFPKLLREIHDPPSFLFSQGTLSSADELSIAIVGSRHASRYGLVQAEKLARGLSLAGLSIVSGLARGIDQAAHRGALAVGGRTVAVLGSGHLHIYPPEHVDLAHEICRSGAVITESHPNHPPKGTAFPQRNRIVTGMSLGVIVVEASSRSGALISARLAIEQGREVFAVPGRVDSRLSQGCHRLIRDGAKLIESVDDVLEELGPLFAPVQTASGVVVHHPAELQLNQQETLVLQAIENEPTQMDDIVVRSQLPIHRVLSTISVLEMRRLIRRTSGTSVMRV